MSKRVVTGIMLTLLFIGMLTLAFNIQSVKGEPIDRGNSVILEFDFPSPVMTEDFFYSSVTLSGLPQYGAPGEPILPFRMVKALIPQGNDVLSVDVTAGDGKVLEGSFNLGYGKTPVRISSNVTPIDQPNQAIYSSANPFPSVLFSQMSEQHLRGYKILMLKLHPVQYVPKTGEVSYFETMTVTVNMKKTSTTSLLVRDLPQDRALVLDIVDNPNEVNTYTKTLKPMRSTSLVNPSDPYDYVIITNNVLESSFQPLVNWKIQKGLNATIVLMEDIMSDPDYNCEGLFGDGCGTTKLNDTQAHIRNFIKDAYINWGTEYILLGGDDEIIPSRGVYCWGDNIPCDMYYGTLDGSWDNDNDTIFGEDSVDGTAGEEADFFAEVYIGRATVDTPSEVTNFVSKTLAYEQNPNASYLNKALMIGEYLDSITKGGNAKDLVTDIIPQYTTTRLYSRDGTFSGTAVINEMNSGTHIVNHVGHANPITVMGLYRPDFPLGTHVDGLNNTDYFMAYSTGCYSAAFDEATSGPEEAIAEHFIFSKHGAFAYIGNSRSGFYAPGGTDGPGERYDQSFFKVLREDIRNVGKALQLSKEREPLFNRYIYYTLNLLGDPETEIATAIKAPTAHFETRTDLLTFPRIAGLTKLRGTAKRGTSVDATFRNFTIEFGRGRKPTFWMTTGINLTNNGESEVVNNTLAIWNTSLVEDGTYTLRLTVGDVDGNVGKDWTVKVCANVVHNINTGLVYAEIQEAINAPETLDGHTILVDEDTYHEHVVVNKALSFVGENRHNTIIDGQNRGIVLNVMANKVNITGFTITRGGAYPYGGILIDHSSGNNIMDNIITNNGYGITLSVSSNNTISGNTITNNEYGLRLYLFSNNTISGNTITNNEYGIWSIGSSNSKFYHNNFIDNTYPVHLLYSVYANFWDNGYPSGGNYWSDHFCTGNPSDGSQPYIIDAKNIDHYPFQAPNGWYSPLTVTSSPIAGITFTIDGIPHTTPYTERPPEGSYTLEMPETHGEYLWSHWLEDGDTNRTKTIVLTGNTTWTGVFRFQADINGDGIVDISDVVIVALCFGSTVTEPSIVGNPYDPQVDLNNDGIIDIVDLVIIGVNFGKTG